MNLIKNILTGIGAFFVLTVLVAFATMGDKIVKVSDLDSGALPAYMKMFDSVLEYGDPAKAMMNEYEVNEDVTNDDVAESIEALAEEYNMRVTGDIKMFTNEDAVNEQVKHARIFSLCSLHIAKIFLNHSKYFGGFMPCRVILLEYGNGKRRLVTMDMTLAIHGGKPLPAEMLELGLSVKKAMEEIPERATQGDF